MPTDKWLERLAAHRASGPEEQRHVDTTRAFIATTPQPGARATLSGHVTGSAVVLDETGRALLLHHARLGLWVQPGGHMDDGELDPADTALREATEETGLADLALDTDPDGPTLLDVDVHLIPDSPKRREAAHLHHDLCYLARTRSAAQARIDPDESRAMRWVTAAGLDALELDPATRRRLTKAFALPPRPR